MILGICKAKFFCFNQIYYFFYKYLKILIEMGIAVQLV